MYKILVVEDETIEREAIISIIQKNFNGILSATSATNGFDAMQMLEVDKPDILLCDINVPIKNGLEVIRDARRLYPQCYALVLTSYDIFEYAHEAIKLGVEDFMLKPIHEDHLSNTIHAVINKIDQEKNKHSQTSNLVLKMESLTPIVESDCIHSIVKKSNPVIIRKFFFLLNIVPKVAFCIILMKDAMKRSHLSALKQELEDIGYRVMQDNYYETLVIFVFSLSELTQSDITGLEYKMQQHFGDMEKIGVGSICNTNETFYYSYIDAILNMGKEITLKPYTQDSPIHHDWQEVVIGVCDELLEDFNKFDTIRIKNHMDAFYLKILYYDVNTLKKAIVLFNQHLLKLVNEQFELHINEMNFDYFIELHNDNPHKELKEKLELVANNFASVVQDQDKNATNILVKKAIAYISLHYMRPITLKAVADYLGVTPFYISKLLSTHTTQNFTDLVTYYRIRKAKVLLNEDYQIKEIAYTLGFKSHNYFTKVFKRVTGVTPKEYKEKMQ